ncbi:stearoyl-CoA desaturase (delta-9 desaturase) [Nitrosomonas ureae]|uniref:Stearoyl-CoA desaturase (Delta-9 desaturase) n=1 Tax=Nitrosomonas ureae TaxID=44577 RepID=A0A1H5YGT1_9PROT|nr:stearoyl-CoA desaturase (delta-9 desaturase) [Nitrosomonas ureae]
MYIRILEMLDLATVCKVAPKIRFNLTKFPCDADTLKAVIAHRYDVLARFAKYLNQPTITEIHNLSTRAIPGLQDARALEAVRHWLQTDVGLMAEKDQVELDQALHSSQLLSTIYSMRQNLVALWSSSTTSTEQLVKDLENWCVLAEESGIGALQEFSRKLRCYN